MRKIAMLTVSTVLFAGLAFIAMSDSYARVPFVQHVEGQADGRPFKADFALFQRNRFEIYDQTVKGRLFQNGDMEILIYFQGLAPGEMPANKKYHVRHDGTKHEKKPDEILVVLDMLSRIEDGKVTRNYERSISSYDLKLEFGEPEDIGKEPGKLLPGKIYLKADKPKIDISGEFVAFYPTGKYIPNWVSGWSPKND